MSYSILRQNDNGIIVPFDEIEDLKVIADIKLYADKNGHLLLTQQSIYGSGQSNVPVTDDERQRVEKIVDSLERPENTQMHRRIAFERE